MDLDQLRNDLIADGWGEVGPGRHLGIDFDLVGSRRYTLTKWNILVKAVPKLDAEAAVAWQGTFNTIGDASKSFLRGKCFLLCLLADEISPDVLQSMSGDAFGLFGALRMKGGGGNIFIADATTRRVYGKVPRLPIDVHKFSKSTTDILQRVVLASAVPPAKPAAPEAAAQCPSCGNPVREGARFCDSCGADLAPACAECGAALRPGAKFCDNCGAPVVAEGESGEE